MQRPEREYDEEGNEFILEHIGPELMRFELDDAIRREILAPFQYFALPYSSRPKTGIEFVTYTSARPYGRMEATP